MKNFPTHTILIFFLVVSFVLVLLLEFFFADAKELFVGGKKLSDLTTNLCLAYISGYFFYLVTVVLPKRAEREHIKEHAAHLIDRILFHILFIMQDATNYKISQKSLKIESLNIESFRLACKDVFMDNDLSALRASKHGRPLKVGEAVSQNIQELQNTINQIFKYSPYIESELISLISSASRNTLNESWINYNNMVPLHIGNHVLMAVRTDVSGYAECLLEYHTLFRAIETILVKEYKSTIVAQKYIANIAALKAS